MVLEHLELVRGLESVVAADRDQGIHPSEDRAWCTVLQQRGRLGIGQVAGMRHILARVGAGRADQDAARVPRPAQCRLVQDHVVRALLHRVSGAVFDQVGIAVKDAEDLDAVAEEG